MANISDPLVPCSDDTSSVLYQHPPNRVKDYQLFSSIIYVFHVIPILPLYYTLIFIYKYGFLNVKEKIILTCSNRKKDY